MSDSFNQKVLDRSDSHSHVLFKSHDSHPHVPVLSLDGRHSINIKASQKVTINKQNVTAHIKASGTYSTILGSSSSVDIPIKKGSGYGHVNNAILTFTITNNSGSSVTLVGDATLWIDYIQKIYGKECLFEYTDTYSPKEWKIKSRLRQGNQFWNKKNLVMLNGESRDIYIDLIPFCLKTGSMFMPALDDIVLRIFFQGSGRTLISELLVDSAVMSKNEYMSEMSKYINNSLDFSN